MTRFAQIITASREYDDLIGPELDFSLWITPGWTNGSGSTDSAYALLEPWED